MQILSWLILGLEALLALPVLYLCIVSVFAILNAKRRKRDCETYPAPRTRFAILIPAHNERAVLGTLLDNLAELNYPRDRYAVFVVADNCTDTTAELARARRGVHVYERFDQDQRGKGYALNWLLRQLKNDHLRFDAYVMLDADSVVDASFLLAMNRELLCGARALQGRYTVLNATDSPNTALRWIALSLMNHVRQLGRNAIGGSSALTGNGMCFSHGLLEEHPWQAFSIIEDYEYYLELVQHGERIVHVPDAVVRAVMPTTLAQMETQEIRWSGSGASQHVWPRVWMLLKSGVRNADFVRLEAIAELLTPPLSFLLTWCLLTALGSLLVDSLPGLYISLILTAGVLYYLGTGIYLLRPPRKIYLALLHAPRFVLWKLWVLLVLKRRGKNAGEWIRTSRTAE